MTGPKMGGSLKSMNMGLLSPVSGRRQLVKVFGANARIGEEAYGYSTRNKIVIGENDLAIGVGEGSGVTSNSDAQG